MRYHIAVEVVSLSKTEHKTDNFRVFDQGASFQCLTDGKSVIKFTKAGSTEEEAIQEYRLIHDGYGILRKFLGEYAQESTISLEKGLDGWIVGIEQEFVSGAPLRSSLNSGNPLIRDFFIRSLSMYKETGLVPDLSPDIMFDPTLGIYLTGKYTYRSNPNVLITEGQPRLIDVVLGKSARRRRTGLLVRSLVARRIRSLLK